MQIIHNGSKWYGEGPDSIEVLLGALATETLDPTFEEYGNFVFPADAVTGTVRVWGNFLTVSHVFDLAGTPEELAPVIAAIRANQQTKAYQTALASRSLRRRKLDSVAQAYLDANAILTAAMRQCSDDPVTHRFMVDAANYAGDSYRRLCGGAR